MMTATPKKINICREYWTIVDYDGCVATSRRRPVDVPTKGERREAELLAAARRLVEAGSFDDASVADLAAEAGVSRPSFYFYFASKDQLLARLVSRVLEDIAASLSDGLADSTAPPTERLADAISRGVDVWWGSREVMRAALELAATDPAVYDRVLAALGPVNSMCVDLLIQHGTVPESRSRQAATELVDTLALMNERVLAHAVRTATTREDLRPTERRLLSVWVRAMGLG